MNEHSKIQDAKQRINLNNPTEVKRWCQELGCTEAVLERGVAQVGTLGAAGKVWLTIKENWRS